MRAIKWLLILSFLVHLQTGQNLLIRDAVGFALIEKEYDGVKKACHGFFDRKGNPMLVIPSEYIKAVVFLPEHEVM